MDSHRSTGLGSGAPGHGHCRPDVHQWLPGPLAAPTGVPSTSRQEATRASAGRRPVMTMRCCCPAYASTVADPVEVGGRKGAPTCSAPLLAWAQRMSRYPASAWAIAPERRARSWSPIQPSLIENLGLSVGGLGRSTEKGRSAGAVRLCGRRSSRWMSARDWCRHALMAAEVSVPAVRLCSSTGVGLQGWSRSRRRSGCAGG